MHSWRTPWESLVDRFNAWGDGEAGAYVSFAMWMVDGLHYLAEVDLHAFLPSIGERTLHKHLRGYKPDTVSLSHVRWATGDAVTALDLCAATIGRVILGPLAGSQGRSRWTS